MKTALFSISKSSIHSMMAALCLWLSLSCCGGELVRPEWCGEGVEWHAMEAEDLADGLAWVVQEHRPAWYLGTPLGDKMLTGSREVTEEENQPLRATFEIRIPGKYTLWLRVLASHSDHSSPFSVTLSQEGRELAAEEIDSAKAKKPGEPMEWRWVGVSAEAAPGALELELARPAKGASWLARNLDLLLLTNAKEYQPDLYDFLPRLYIRWSGTGEEIEPFCWYGFVHRGARPWFARPGIWDATGLTGKYGAPRDRSQWLSPGQTGEWADLSPYLLPDGKYNRLHLTATRGDHQKGWVKERIRGKLEFAVGQEKRVIHEVEIDQVGPRVMVILSGDMTKPGAFVHSGREMMEKSRKAAEALGEELPRARYLDLNAHLRLDMDSDDRELLDAELSVLKRLGFNGIYEVPTKRADAGLLEWYRKSGLELKLGLTRTGAWFKMKDGDYTRPELEQIEAVFRNVAENSAEVLEHGVRINLGDEPAGQKWESLMASPTVLKGFVDDLKAEGLTPEALGVKGWEDVVITPYRDREKHPALYYQSALYRLKLGGEHARKVVSIKRRYLPDNVKTYVNYSPLFSWTDRGVDPFMTQRNGGLEMGWSEDWLGYNASPQYTADTYALLRAAGRGQPLGGYMVGVSGEPEMQRIKYYTMVAAGVREVNVYSYGPGYATVDSWSEDYELYPVIREVQGELARIDPALHETRRRTSPIAILYNRTAAIWAGGDLSATAELDARFLRWALSHAGYDAALIPEEDVVAGELAQYKVLYLSGIQLRSDAADAIAKWVGEGGVLMAGAGAGTRDEWNRPASRLEAVFAARSRNLREVEAVGRPNYELRALRTLNRLILPNLPEGMSQLAYKETLAPLDGGEILLHGPDEEVLGVTHRYGKGRTYRVAALAGLAYLQSATRGADYKFRRQLPEEFDSAIRQLIAMPAQEAGILPLASSNLKAGEIVRYDGEGRSVLFVINYAGSKIEDFSFLLPDAQWARKAYTADGKPVRLEPAENGAVRIRFPLNVAGAVVLERE